MTVSFVDGLNAPCREGFIRRRFRACRPDVKFDERILALSGRATRDAAVAPIGPAAHSNFSRTGLIELDRP
jgi:hypothetical protein